MWDAYVHDHPRAVLYHLFGWQNIIRETYGHNVYYLLAIRDNHSIAGILPLVHIRHLIFGNTLTSIPFFDMGGILADDVGTEKALLAEAIRLGRKLRVENIELRHTAPLSCWSDSAQEDHVSNPQILKATFATRSHKVLMRLALPESPEVLMKSFKAKLRSQIKRPLKAGLHAKIGGAELLDDFYDVFLINMRDLGSPVHSKAFMKNVLRTFPGKAGIVMVCKEHQPAACSLVVGFKDTLENPWASALRQYSRLSPNMLLYWAMLEHACENGYACFDFGRSTPGEGTYKFKAQWGAKPAPLNWHNVFMRGDPGDIQTPETSKFDKAIQYWQKLPVSATKIIGPMIRKYIRN